MPKRVADLVYLDPADSSGVETEYENTTYEEDGFLFLRRRKIYKIRYERKLPKWLKEEEDQKKNEEAKQQRTDKKENSKTDKHDSK